MKGKAKRIDIIKPTITLTDHQKSDLEFFCQIEPCLSILKDKSIKEFILNRSITYGQLTGLPSHWLPDIINILKKNIENPELAIKKIQKKYPDLTNYESSYHQKLKEYRTHKVKILAKRINYFIKGSSVLDFGGQTCDFLDEIVKINRNIKKAYVTGINKEETMPRSSSKVEFLVQPNLYSTQLSTDEVDTILISLVLHHIDKSTRQLLLNHFLSILKPGGRVILIEDSFPGNNVQADIDMLMKTFLAFNTKEKMDILSFLDWQGNRLTRLHSSVPLFFSFEEMECWQNIFEDLGFKTVVSSFIGNIVDGQIDLLPPKAMFVFELPK